MSQEPHADLVIARSRSQRQLPTRSGPGQLREPLVAIAHRVDEESDSISFQQLAIAFRRNRWLALAIVIASLSAAAAYTRLANPVYTSSATIRIDDKDNGNSLLTGIASMPGMTSGKIQTEIEVMRSRQLAENVARQLHLNVEVLKPARARRMVRVLNNPQNVPRSKLVLTRKSDGRYGIRQDGDDPPVRLPADAQTEVPFYVGPSQLVLYPPAAGPPPEELTVQIRPIRDAVEDMSRQLTVSRPNREAQIVSVSFKGNDRVLTAAVPNLILDEFMRYKAQTNRTEASSTVSFLRQQVASYEDQLKAAEAALGAYRVQAQVVSIGAEAEAQVKQMAALEAERGELRAERQSLAAILQKDHQNGSTARDIAAFPSFVMNRGMQDILQSLISLDNQRSQLLLRRNPENADVVALTTRINELEGQLTQMARGYLSGLDSKLSASNASVQSFGRQIETIPAREIAFARLSRQQKLLQDISTLLQTRLKEAEIKEAVQPGDVRVIDRALIPERPTSPKPAMNMLLGLFAGIFLGGIASVARQTLDNKVRTKEDAEDATNGVPVLGAIPRIVQGGQAGRLNGKAATSPNALMASSAAAQSALLTQRNSREGPAEAYRALRTNITFAAFSDHANQVVVLTSALPGDGKSTTAANLALTLAHQGVRTLLIDADMRKGCLYSLFSVRRKPGLSELLIGQTDLASALQILPQGDDAAPLHLLTSGQFPPNPAELLGSERMQTLLDDLRQQFDMIIFDSPPLTLVTDAAVLGTFADSTILVARAGVTDKRALALAASQLAHLRVHVSGTIVNDFNPKEAGYGYGYGYGSYGESD